MKKSHKMTMKTLAASFFLAFNIAEAQLTVIATGDNYNVGGVSNNGMVSMQVTTAGKIFTWTQTEGLVQIGSVDSSVAGIPTISSNGTVVAATYINSATGVNEISTYDVASSTWTNRGAFPATGSGGGHSSSWGMSADGSTVVGLGLFSASLGHAVKWTQAGGLIDLGSIVNGSSSRANGVNSDGSVIVGWQDLANGARRGAKWVNGIQTFITDNNGNNVGEAFGVSADGNIIIGTHALKPYVWDSVTGLTTITHPNSSATFRGAATCISSDGSKVLGYYRIFNGPPMGGEGFIWTKTGGRINLNDYVTSLGIATNGITLGFPAAISQDGTKIAGTGMNASNIPVAFYLDLSRYLSVHDAEKEKDKNDITVYPNPVTDILYFKGTSKIEKAEVYNMAGQKVKSFGSVNDRINVSSLLKGDYILQYSVKGKGQQSYKFIKK